MSVLNKRAPGSLGYIGDEILASHIGIIIISHYKDPYEPTSIMERNKDFFHGSNMFGIFTPKLGEDEPNLTEKLFFRWVGNSTTKM